MVRRNAGTAHVIAPGDRGNERPRQAFDLAGITNDEAKNMAYLSIFDLPRDYLITEQRAAALYLKGIKEE